jgi:hypothetical protein
VNLVVHVPDDPTDESASALSLARRAPTFSIEWEDNRRIAVAVFPSLPDGIDMAVQLVGETVRIPAAWASVNARRQSSLAKLWQRLACYRDSLSADDPARYCLEQSAHFHTLVGCEGHRCPVSCQFICAPCLKAAQESGGPLSAGSYHAAAILAEVEWCPRLDLRAAADHVIDPSRLRPG